MGSRTNVGVAFDGRDSAATLSEFAKAADTMGSQSLWIANHLFERDPFSAAAVALAATSGPRVVLMGVSPYTVHPVQAVMAAATMDELFPGRVALCFGAGAPRDLASAGIAAHRPLQTLKESLEIARALLAGERLTYAGKIFQVKGRALSTGARPVPLVLAATGPRMLELAGTKADGVILSGGSSIAFIRWALDEVDRAARGRRVERMSLVYAAIADGEDIALDRLRRTLAITLRGAHQRRNIQLGGAVIDQDALTEAVAIGDWRAAERHVPDDVVRRHGAAGTPAQVCARLAEYRAAGLDEIVIAGIRDPLEIPRALTLAGM